MHEHVLFRPIPDPLEALKIYDAETLIKAAALGNPDAVPKNFFPEENHPITLWNRGYLESHYPNAENAFALTEDLMTGEIGDFASIGGKSILDCSVPHERGDPRIVKRMSERIGVNIIMSTGINSASLIPRRFKSMSVGELVGFFEEELHQGMDGTGIPAGNIKLLVDGKRIAGDDELGAGSFLRGLEAAANVSSNSGAPVVVHAYCLSQDEFSFLLTQAKRFGMPLGRMVFSHFDTNVRELRYETLLGNPEAVSLELDLGRRVMDEGATLSFDLLGAEWVDSALGLAAQDDAFSLAAIAQYAREGYADRIVLGTDTWNRLATRRFGGHGMSHLLNFVVPTLLRYGTSERDVDLMTVHNPGRLLAF